MKDLDKRVEFHFLVFSGRPNPVLPVEGKLLEDVKNKYEAAIKSKYEGALPESRLGYQGFLIMKNGADVQLPDSLKVFNGVVIEANGKKVQYWNDVDGLEKRLLAEIKNSFFAQLIDIFEIED